MDNLVNALVSFYQNWDWYDSEDNYGDGQRDPYEDMRQGLIDSPMVMVKALEDLEDSEALELAARIRKEAI